MDSQRPVVIVTGASRGLGLAMVKALIAENRFHVIATARSSSISRFHEEGIEDSDHVWVRQLDVLLQSERFAVIKEAENLLGGIDVLINNAGFMLRAVVEHVGEVQRFKQMDTNFRGPMAMSKAILPNMRKKRRGHIINISSVGGMMSMPTMSVYSASKFALEGASEAMWYEVRPWNIKVSLVQLGFIKSDSYKNVKMTRESEKSIHDQHDPYYHHYNSMVPFIEFVMERARANPHKIAKKIVKLIDSKHPPLRIAMTIDAHFFKWLRWFVPSRLYHLLLYYGLPKVLRWGKDDSGES